MNGQTDKRDMPYADHRLSANSRSPLTMLPERMVKAEDHANQNRHFPMGVLFNRTQVHNVIPEVKELRHYKRRFLIFQHNKYFTVATTDIAYFCIKAGSVKIVTLDNTEYPVNYSMESIQQFLPISHFFRLNRQYLINFDAVKEAEPYFARRLLITLFIQTTDILLVPKEKVSVFLHWLENR